MKITRSSIATVKGPADWFTGDVYIDAVAVAVAVAAGPAPSRVTANLVHFTPGARTHWHRHPLGPSSSPRSSACASAAADRSRSSAPQRPRPLRSRRGALARRPPDRLMVHLAMNEGDADHDIVHWLTDEEYAAAPATD
ncbi:cupin domain-containing protein [Streptomyces sp. NPDC047917]|uniref:cupin domain-containing protein n=1 Tax=Streptomyces sp. NPDC047917 TaxID=3365491 RepID=UPI00371605DF